MVFTRILVTNPIRIHAVINDGNGNTYQYDDIGNQSLRSSDNRTLEYTVFNKAEKIEIGSNQVEYSYGLDTRKLSRKDQTANVNFEEPRNTHTWYIGNVEVIYHNAGQINERIEYKRYLGGNTLIQYNSGFADIKYIHKDHLGSTQGITDQSFGTFLWWAGI